MQMKRLEITIYARFNLIMLAYIILNLLQLYGMYLIFLAKLD